MKKPPNRGRASKYKVSRGGTWFYSTVGDYPLWGDGGAKAYGTTKTVYAQNGSKSCVLQSDERRACCRESC